MHDIEYRVMTRAPHLHAAFRERAFRYAAAEALAWVTLEGLDDREQREAAS